MIEQDSGSFNKTPDQGRAVFRMAFRFVKSAGQKISRVQKIVRRTMFGIDKCLSYYTDIVGEKDGDEDTGELIVVRLFSRMICTDD